MIMIKNASLLCIFSIFLISCSASNEKAHEKSLAFDSSTPAIIGGNVVSGTLNTGKYVVGMFAPRFGNCSGVLITEDIVLTAAHCIPPNPRSLTLIFDTNLNSASQLNMRPVIAAKVTPYWAPTQVKAKNKGDLALIRFQGPVPNGYKPAPLLANSYYLGDRSFTLIAGFGLSSQSRQVGQTSGVLREVYTTITQSRYSETEVLLSQLNGLGTCAGDSGGPAFILINGVYYLWGITSHGDLECVTHGIYTNIVVYRNWILKTIPLLRLQNF